MGAPRQMLEWIASIRRRERRGKKIAPKSFAFSRGEFLFLEMDK